MSQDLEATTVELEWVYTPPDFFEESIVQDRGDYRVEIQDGRVMAHMTAAVYESQPDFQERLDQELRSYFHGTALVRRSSFELKKGHITRILPDGRKSVSIELPPGVIGIRGNPVDFVIHGPQGVIRNTRRERIDETKRLAELARRVTTTDPTARKLLECHDAALRDSANELVHLYEIWEGLVEAFGGGKKGMYAARATLNIDEKRLSRLANNEPLKQGRHRGCHLHRLRDATRQELDEARSIARHMIIRYLEHKAGQSAYRTK